MAQTTQQISIQKSGASQKPKGVPGFVIAAPKSGSGKTLLTAAILEALKQDHEIAAFKVGPDYIDPMFHKAILRTPSINLDPVLVGRENTKYLYAKHVKDKDLAVVEGVMGLFDGQAGTLAGSTADVAKLLGLPVLLVIDSSSMGRSVAALAAGFTHYDPDLKFAGIILNGVEGKRYIQQKQAIEAVTDVPILGYFPKRKEFTLTSRHLGLMMPDELADLDTRIKKAAKIIKETVNFKPLLSSSVPLPIGKDPFRSYKCKFDGLRVGIARDEAFCFYYQDNLELLKDLGCELVYFSPLHDKLPPAADLYYFGGGYPELHKEALSENKNFLEALKRELDNGRYALAECGGMMVLGQAIDDVPMAGFFDFKTRFSPGLKNFGYHDLKFKDKTFKVHEFHHSDYEGRPDGIFELTKNGVNHVDGYKKNNVIAGYPHIHFYAYPDGPAFLLSLLEEIYAKRTSTGDLR